jgi:gamma-glutamyltranspeptidase/glutathione hydrolase
VARDTTTGVWSWETRSGLAGPHGGATRPVAMGRSSAVSAAHGLASQAGLEVLDEGGNAFDAAVAVSAMVPLGEPHMSGIGGLGYATMYHAASDTCITLDFEGGPPAAFASLKPGSVADDSGLPTAWVPTVVAAWEAILGRYGSLGLDRLLRPAIDYAERGMPVSFHLSAVIEAVGKATGPVKVSKTVGFSRDLLAAEVFMPGGRPPRPGELLVQKRLAATLETIGREGPRAFYEGSIASEIARACASAGGHITLSDLSEVRAEWKPSLHTAYRGLEVHTVPWPTGGAQVLETLRLLGGFDLAQLGIGSADHLHALIECVKIAEADRLAHLDEQNFDPTSLFEEQYLERRRATVDPARAARGGGDELTVRGRDPVASSHTTHFVVGDRHRNLISWTQTVGPHFGSKAIAGDTGILINSMLPKFARRGLPMTPTVVLSRDGAPWMAVGSVGSTGIMQTVPQMISNVVDFGLNPQAALEAARIRVLDGLRVMMESRVSAETRSELAARGHICEVVGEWGYGEGQVGRGQMIISDGSGSLFAASDPRADGSARAR